MAIQFPRGFLITTDEPIDIKLVLTKSQMVNAEELFMMPSPYFCLCSDDNKIYIYNVNNEIIEDPTKEFYGLGRFRPTDIEVKNLIKAETDRAVEVENELAAAIETESAERLAKDTELTELLNTETSGRTAADEVLDSKISTLEENTNTKIDQEITDRQNEITRIESLISAEATTRDTDDKAILAKIGGSFTSENTVAKAIFDAQTAAEAKVTALENGQVTTNKNDIAIIKSTYVKTSVYDAKVADLDNKINQEVKDRGSEVARVEDLISTEKARAEGIEAGLRTDITNIQNNIASGLHFRGIKEALTDITDPVNGDIVIIGTQEYIYADGEWEEFGNAEAHATVEYVNTELAKKVNISDYDDHINKYNTHITAQASIDSTQDTKIADIETSLAEGGTINTLIKAAQTQANKGVIDAKTAQDAVDTLAGKVTTAEGNISTLQTKVTSLEGTYTDAQIDLAISTAVAEEKSRAEEAESNLDTALTSFKTSTEAAILKNEKEIEKVATQVRVYEYLTPSEEENITSLNRLNTEYRINAISAKGLSDDISSIELITAPLVHNTDPIFEISENASPIVLYQTGLLEDIKTTKYAYDNINFLTHKLERHCKVITFKELVDNTVSTDWTWSGTGTPNGRLTISHTKLLEIFGVHTEINFYLKTTEDTLFEIRGISSVNIGISNLKTDSSITNKATALSALSTTYGHIGVIFKAATPEYHDLATYNIKLLIQDIKVSTEPVYIYNIVGTLQVSYLSLNDLVYSKDQVDDKFVTQSSMSDKTHFYNLKDTTASADLFDTILTKTATIANFKDNDGTVPFTGPTMFLKQNADNLLVYSNNKTYSWTSNTDFTVTADPDLISYTNNSSTIQISHNIDAIIYDGADGNAGRIALGLEGSHLDIQGFRNFLSTANFWRGIRVPLATNATVGVDTATSLYITGEEQKWQIGIDNKETDTEYNIITVSNDPIEPSLLFKSTANAEYGLILPDTTDFTENKTIATTNYVDTEVSKKADKTELHSHSNKDILDNITAAFTTELKAKLDDIEGQLNYATTAEIEALFTIN